MGFKPSSRVVVVKLADYVDEGEEPPTFRLKRLRVGQAAALSEMVGLAQAADGAEALKVFHNLADEIAAGLAGWNYVDDDDQPIPITPETVRAELELMMTLDIVNGWLGGLDIDAPLPSPSANGKPPPELFEQTDPSSPAPQNSPAPN